MTFGSNVIVGNQGNGTASISAGTFSNTAGIFYVGVGNAQTGTLNVSGTASVSLNQLNLGYQTGTTSIVNLDGGILNINSQTGGAGGTAAVANTSTFNFNGGTLKAGAGFTTATGVSTVVKSGGAVIDTNGNNLVMSTALTTVAVAADWPRKVAASSPSTVPTPSPERPTSKVARSSLLSAARSPIPPASPSVREPCLMLPPWPQPPSRWADRKPLRAQGMLVAL